MSTTENIDAIKSAGLMAKEGITNRLLFEFEDLESETNKTHEVIKHLDESHQTKRVMHYLTDEESAKARDSIVKAVEAARVKVTQAVDLASAQLNDTSNPHGDAKNITHTGIQSILQAGRVGDLNVYHAGRAAINLINRTGTVTTQIRDRAKLETKFEQEENGLNKMIDEDMEYVKKSPDPIGYARAMIYEKIERDGIIARDEVELVKNQANNNVQNFSWDESRKKAVRQNIDKANKEAHDNINKAIVTAHHNIELVINSVRAEIASGKQTKSDLHDNIMRIFKVGVENGLSMGQVMRDAVTSIKKLEFSKPPVIGQGEKEWASVVKGGGSGNYKGLKIGVVIVFVIVLIFLTGYAFSKKQNGWGIALLIIDGIFIGASVLILKKIFRKERSVYEDYV
jgi:hypothetical protein